MVNKAYIPIPGQEENVSSAFSRQSVVFDEIDEDNDTILWMRKRVHDEVLKFAQPGMDMLELNCGTGIDAVYFSKKGINVHATDNADGMLLMLNRKIKQHQLGNRLSFEKCSFNNLGKLKSRQYDYMFSNFGGLNCAEDLSKILNDLNDLLKPGGYFTFVIMPKVCPWELIMLFKGYFKTAFRRFNKNGANAHVEGVYFNCYYYDPSYITDRMHNFELCSLKGLSITVPPPFIEHFKLKHPRLFSFLERIENKLWDKSPFSRWSDHYMITMQKKI